MRAPLTGTMSSNLNHCLAGVLSVLQKPRSLLDFRGPNHMKRSWWSEAIPVTYYMSLPSFPSLAALPFPPLHQIHRCKRNILEKWEQRQIVSRIRMPFADLDEPPKGSNILEWST